MHGATPCGAPNLDDDADEELIIGVRDNTGRPHRRGVRIYDPHSSAATAQIATAAHQVARQLIDPGGVAVEDLAAADLDGDGDIDIVAVGRATKNVKIYWNEAAK